MADDDSTSSNQQWRQQWTIAPLKCLLHGLEFVQKGGLQLARLALMQRQQLRCYLGVRLCSRGTRLICCPEVAQKALWKQV